MRFILRTWVLVCASLLAAACSKDPADSGRSGSGGSGVNRPAGSGGEGGVDGGESGVGGGESGAGGEGGGEAGVGGAPGIVDAGPGPNPNAVMPGTICDRLATIQCEGERLCCDEPGRDFDACKQAQKGGCMTEYMGDAIAAQPAAGFDAAQALIVFTEIERLAMACDPSVAAFGDSPQGLRSVFKGTVNPNGSCLPQRPWIKVEAGGALASCKQNDAYACLPREMAPWICRPRAEVGGDCFSDANCKPGLFCDNPNLDPNGSTCKARKPDGATCEVFNECASLFCKASACVPATQQAAYCLKE